MKDLLMALSNLYDKPSGLLLVLGHNDSASETAASVLLKVRSDSFKKAVLVRSIPKLCEKLPAKLLRKILAASSSETISSSTAMLIRYL